MFAPSLPRSHRHPLRHPLPRPLGRTRSARCSTTGTSNRSAGPRTHGRRLASLGLAVVVCSVSSAALAAEVKLPISRDTRVSSFAGEELANLGGATRWRFKSYQEFVLCDAEVDALRGRTIRQATLYVRSTDPRPLLRITCGTLNAEFVEGTNASGYQPQPGASSFRWRQHPDVPWADPGSDLCSVILGAGHSRWRSADAFPPDADGWQRIAVEPNVLAARVAGLCGGWVVFDDTGSEWRREGERYEYELMPARAVYSREERPDRRPYFLVQTGPDDHQPPPAVQNLRADAAAPQAPEDEAQWIRWSTPDDVGPAGVLGFQIELNGQRVPFHRVPAAYHLVAAAALGESLFSLRRSDWPAQGPLQFTVRPVDAAGNVGPATTLDVPPLPARRSGTLAAAPTVPAGDQPSPQWSGQPLRWLHPLAKIDLKSGELVGDSSSPAAGDPIDLYAARNEWVGFQVLFPGGYSGPVPRLQLTGTSPPLTLHVSQLVGVPVGSRRIPDPAVPVQDRLEVPAPADRAAGARWGATLVEWLVPADYPAGQHSGQLVFDDGRQQVKLPVRFTVWPFALPNQLTFVPEMNCYGLPEAPSGGATTGASGEIAWYRLAQLHRTCLNRLPYHHNGRVSAGCAPEWNGKEFDWQAWDQRFAPLFDGSAFADLPRGPVPVEAFYLPLFENWPTPIEPHFNGDYWADRALSAEYRERFVSASQQWAEHLHARRWTGTMFQFYLNGKNEYKRNGWSRSTSPWTLDEPANFQDFYALRWFGEAFHTGIQQAAGPARIGFRVDISRPQWQRESLDGLVDFNVVGGELRRYPRIVLERARRNGEWLVEYGAANPLEASNVQPAAWCLDAWLLGLNGVLPWQTLGTEKSWEQADPLALLYPPAPRSTASGPVPSLRLKSFRYGQQLVEILSLLEQAEATSRAELRRTVLATLPLQAQREGSGFTGGEDAGRLAFHGLSPTQLEVLRVRAGQTVAGHRPPVVAIEAPFRPRPRHPPLPSLLVSSGEQPVWQPRPYTRTSPASATAPRTGSPSSPGKTPAGRHQVVQGKPAVEDVLLDPERPDERWGGEARNNALRRTERGNALLIRFQLAEFRGRGAELRRAILRVRCWDPSSQGTTRLDVAPLNGPWTESEATWRAASRQTKWSQGEFTPGQDTAAAVARTAAPPDEGSDLADPPIVLEWDITPLVRQWLAGQRPNHGLAILPVVDRSVDEGRFTRLQVYGSEWRAPDLGPALELHW